MQHYIKPCFAKNAKIINMLQNSFNSEVNHIWISSFLLKLNPQSIVICPFINILHIYVRNYLIRSILLAICNAMCIKPSIILRIIGKVCEHSR